jgi:hypothetical protein
LVAADQLDERGLVAGRAAARRARRHRPRRSRLRRLRVRRRLPRVPAREGARVEAGPRFGCRCRGVIVVALHECVDAAQGDFRRPHSRRLNTK